MTVTIGFRIELRSTQDLEGAIFCEDKFEAVAVPQRGDLVALAAIAGLPTEDQSLTELRSVNALADTFPFMKIDHLEHYPTAEHQVGEEPAAIVVLHGRAPSDDESALALVRLFGFKGWIISPGLADSERSTPFSRAAHTWLVENGESGQADDRSYR